MIKIILAEDQKMLNSALTMLLNLEADLNVIESLTDGQIAWQQIMRQQPDIALLDIEMPHLTGLKIAEKINAHKLATKVIILTTFANKSYFEQAVAAQVNGYLLKDHSSEDLISSIRAINDGQTIYDPELVQSILSEVANPLTRQEQNVLQKMASGADTAEISTSLYLSRGTVRNYISAILSKLGARNRIEAIKVAHENHWL